MANHMILLLAICITFIYSTNSRKIAPPPHVPNLRLVPPQPSQYSASVITNGIPAMYYADTTIYRDRFDEYNQNYTTIIDFQNFRQYAILRGMCSWSQIPGKIKPLLVFPSYLFNGTETHNSTLCYKWTGCHDYEIPPAPFDYYATVKGNIPVDLILPTIGINIHFSNFTFGPPPPTVFDIPSNCTQTKFNARLHPIIPHKIIEHNGVGMFC